MASKQPRRSDLISDSKFITQTTLLPCLYGLFWLSFGQIIKKKKEESVSTRPVSFAAGKSFKICFLALPTQNFFLQ